VTCDLRIAAAGAQLQMPPARLGLVYSYTGVQKFIDTIGAPRTRELFLVGRRVDARTAESWGLINTVVDGDRLNEDAVALAETIASGAPLAQRGNKRIIRELLAARGALDPDAERELLELRRSCFSSEDFQEAIRAFAEKRMPNWQGR
jgi:enoyl-CoA hydratase/carnithine racemase